MREINQYQINVSTRGPHYNKTGRGVWIVAETTPEKATAALKTHFKEHNLFGSIYPAWKITSRIPLERGIVIKREDYFELVEKSKQPGYVFTPAKTEAGEKLHRPNRAGIEYRDKQVNGAFGAPGKAIERMEDCGELHNMEGITFNSQELEDWNLENMIDDMEEER